MDSSQSTPDSHKHRNAANIIILTRFKASVDTIILNDTEIDMHHALIHELLASLSFVMQNGIDTKSYQSPLLGEDSRGFLVVFQQIIASRKATKFVAKQEFLNTSKLKFTIWLFLELASQSLLELLLSQEFQAKYQHSSLIRSNLGDIIDILDTFYSKKLEITGELINRYNKFIDIPTMVQESDDEKVKAPIHKQQEKDTPMVLFKSTSPSIQLDIDMIHDEDSIQEDDRGSQNLNLITIKLKRSSILLKQEYEKYLDNYKFQTLLIKPVVEEKCIRCEECEIEIQKNWLRKSTGFKCEYNGKYYCQNCISNNKSVIPYKIRQSFDFGKYTVSRKAYEQIQESIDMPFIQIDYFDDIVFQHSQLYDFLIMKRQLRLMYDRLCDRFEFESLKDQTNFLLPINLFSIQDFLNIQNKSLIWLSKQAYQEGLNHVKECCKCNQLGVLCKGCKCTQKIYYFDILGTQYCRKCKTLYHRKCFKSNCIECKRRYLESKME